MSRPDVESIKGAEGVLALFRTAIEMVHEDDSS